MASAWTDYKFSTNIDEWRSFLTSGSSSFTMKIYSSSGKAPTSIIFAYNNEQNEVEWEETPMGYCYSHQVKTLTTTSLSIAMRHQGKTIIIAMFKKSWFFSSSMMSAEPCLLVYALQIMSHVNKFFFFKFKIFSIFQKSSFLFSQE